MLGTPGVAWLLVRGSYDVGVPVFLFLAFTDALDGSLARVRRRVTPWGTLYDPVADKLLIGVTVVTIVMKHVNVFFGLLIMAVEALIVLGAWGRRRRGEVIAGANAWGKAKMCLQVLGVVLLLLAVWLGMDLFIPFSVGSLSLAIVFAVISLFTYSL
jgi:CDP-diacylglycerol--glycerol-3-phosphate 3-phosphatidyltransferase